MFTAGTQHLCEHHFHHVTALVRLLVELSSIGPALAGGAQIRAGAGGSPPPLTLTTVNALVMSTDMLRRLTNRCFIIITDSILYSGFARFALLLHASCEGVNIRLRCWYFSDDVSNIIGLFHQK